MSESHTIMDGKVHVYRRENSRFWQCATYLSGRNHRQSTKQDNIAYALEFARDWYLDRVAEDRLRRRGVLPAPAGIPVQSPEYVKPRLPGEKTFREAAVAFQREYEAMTLGERNASYVASKGRVLRLYLLPFFGDLPISQVTAGRIQEYRLHRVTPPTEVKPAHYQVKGRELIGKPRKWMRPSRQTLHNEIVCLRQVLKAANRKGWISALPDMSSPYRASGKISHRAWFSPGEYKRLFEATRERARNPKKERWRGECEQFHDYVLFMVNTGLRPDEAQRLEFRDVSVVVDADTGERILEIEVRGKRGVGYCKSMPGAVLPFQRVKKRKNGRPTELVFGPVQRELLNAVLGELDLKKDRDGNARTAYSLRHTYICLRLMEGADIYQVAKNCRTSVEMIEKYYASHIKNTLDAAAINVRRKPKSRKAPSAKALANA
ncbi:site-specific integrase [Phenylobacterium sp.]|uniref:site-specific integrase n=1 Tax=Phenylobacterium sp. TaxID=1871053 RepID=UPI00289AA82D|nr:site-specific integrase [Phenylobacterium sp.]